MSQVNYKRIAQNATALYLRMIVTMVLGLYTSRVVLQMLGVSDFGIFGLVGGIAGMLSIINASMANATSRYITYELAKGDKEKLSQTFTSALQIHVGIAVIFLLLAETIGLWFVNTQLVIPPERMEAAKWVYQCSVFTAILTITQVPYNAALFAHEKMTVFAYIEILNSMLKLGAALLLVLWDSESRLIWYAIISLLVSSVILFIYRIYCIRHFAECHIKRIWRPKILKPMLSFSAYDLYGNICGLSFYQGTNVILNLFFGVVINAASSIANTVSGVLQGFAFKIIMAFKPSIVKLYAVGDIHGMSRIVNMATTLSVLLMGISSIPLYFEMDYIINLWLGSTPEYVVPFCRLLLIYCTIGIVNAIQIQAIHATGNIKRITFVGGTINLLTMPAMYVALYFGMPSVAAYVIQVIAVTLISTFSILIVKHQIRDFEIRPYIAATTKVIVIILVTAMAIYPLTLIIAPSIISLLALYLLTTIIVTIAAYTCCLDDNYRHRVKAFIAQRIPLFNNKR